MPSSPRSSSTSIYHERSLKNWYLYVAYLSREVSLRLFNEVCCCFRGDSFLEPYLHGIGSEGNSSRDTSPLLSDNRRPLTPLTLPSPNQNSAFSHVNNNPTNGYNRESPPLKPHSCNTFQVGQSFFLVDFVVPWRTRRSWRRRYRTRKTLWGKNLCLPLKTITTSKCVPIVRCRLQDLLAVDHLPV